jgi:hypothetical protein
MKYSLLAAVAALAIGTVATAHAETAQVPPTVESSGNAASLNALLAQWNRAGFNTPVKPAQFRVYGRNGYVTNGPGYNTMVSLIRAAENDARQGRDRDEAISIAGARSLLAAAHGTRSNG